jgi:hypothetical protein
MFFKETVTCMYVASCYSSILICVIIIWGGGGAPKEVAVHIFEVFTLLGCYVALVGIY